MTALTATHGSSPITQWSYSYDAGGNRLTKSDGTATESYDYDPLSRLTGVQKGVQLSTFGYDDVGNRTRTQIGSRVVHAAVSERNELQSQEAGGPLRIRGQISEAGSVKVSGQSARLLPGGLFEAEVPVVEGQNDVVVEAMDANGNTRASTYRIDVPGSSETFTYDPNGNLATKTDADHAWEYEWTVANELSRVRRDGAEVGHFEYDPLGRRIVKAAGSVTIRFSYDGPDILRESHSDGTTLFYVHGPAIDEPLVSEVASGALYFHTDGLSSVVAMSDAGGNVTSTRRYDGWGNLEVGAADAGYAFTGREWDPEIALYYYRARYYDPRIGRFMSEDPIGPAPGGNPYVYALNSPTAYVDPLGLITFVPEPGGPGRKVVSASDIDWANAQVARLRANLTNDVVQYFWQAYGVELGAVLAPGGADEIRLTRGITPAAGRTPEDTYYNRHFGTLAPLINLDRCQEGRDPDRFNATVLHELVHYYHQQNKGWNGGLVNRPEALDAAYRAALQAQGQIPNVLHGPETFLAEIYQYGGWKTYGGGR